MAFTKVKKELFPLEGTVLRKFPGEEKVAKNGKPYTMNKFILKTMDGRDLYVTKFGDFSAEYIGKDVKFQASKYNETSYTLEGDIEELVGVVVTPTTTESTVTPTRRGRPSKTLLGVIDQQVITTDVVEDPREVLRTQAEASTLKDLESAVRLAKHLGLDVKDTIGIVSLADRVGRTITAIGLDNRNRR